LVSGRVLTVCSAQLFGERVVELLHWDPAVAIVVEASHKDVLLVVGHVDVEPKKSANTMCYNNKYNMKRFNLNISASALIGRTAADSAPPISGERDVQIDVSGSRDEWWYLLSQALGEFLEVDLAIVVFVKLAQQVHAVVLHWRVASGLFLDLVEDVLDVLLGEHIGVVLHVLLSVLVSRDELEPESSEEDRASNQEVLLFVVVLRDGVLEGLAMHELATDAAGVLVANFVNLDSVVAAEERDDELSVLIVGLSRDKLWVESEDVHVLLEHLLHVDLGRLGLEGDDWTHGVLLVAVAVVTWHGLVLNGGGRGWQLDWSLGHAELLLVPSLGEIVTVKNHAVTAVDLDRSTASDVSGEVVVFLLEGHAWAMSQNWGLGKLLSLQQFGERCPSWVSCVDLFHLDRVVGQEVVHSVELVATIIGDIVPQNFEAEDATVVVEEALKATVGTATLQLNFDVVLELSLIGRDLLHVDHLSWMSEGISGVVLCGSNVTTFVGEVAASELVAVDDAEHTAMDVQVHTEMEIGPIVVTLSIGKEQFGALEEHSLGNTRVLNLGLNDVERVILKVEVDDALSDTVVLVRVLDDRLKEVWVEFEDL
jgi:hypothetical protein